MYRKIMVAVDGSAAAAQALQAGIALARSLQAQVRLVFVVEEATAAGLGSVAGIADTLRDHGANVLDEAVSAARAAGLDADHARVERPGERLGDAVGHAAREWGADLVVVGTHGRRGVSHLLLGSGAEQIVRSSPVAVLVVRAAPQQAGD